MINFIVHINVDFEREWPVQTLILFSAEQRCQCKGSGLGGQIIESIVYRCFSDMNSLSNSSSLNGLVKLGCEVGPMNCWSSFLSVWGTKSNELCLTTEW